MSVTEEFEDADDDDDDESFSTSSPPADPTTQPGASNARQMGPAGGIHEFITVDFEQSPITGELRRVVATRIKPPPETVEGHKPEPPPAANWRTRLSRWWSRPGSGSRWLKWLPWVGPPAGQSIAFVVVTLLAFLLLGAWQNGDELYTRTEWAVWKFTGALAICAALFAGVKGVGRLADFNAVHRHSDLHGGKFRRSRFLALAVTASCFVGVLLFLLNRAGAAVVRNRHWPTGFDVPPGIILAVSAVASVPWFMLVWMTHETSRDIRLTGQPIHLGRIVKLWDAVTQCVLAFAAFVVIALIPTGAQRALWLTVGDADSDKRFPSSDVLYYGAFFAVALAVVAFPLIASWRRTATDMIEAAHGQSDASRFDKAKDETRTALETRLGLNTGLLRSPLAAFSIFLPLITTLLAAFIPELKAD